MTTCVRTAGRGDWQPVGRALASAFADDPVFRWLIPPDRSDRDQRTFTFFASMARSYLRRGKVVQLAGDGTGAALWSAPGTSWKLPPTEVLRETRAAVRAFGPLLGRALRVQLEVESGHPTEPHWYLGYLGVAQAHQGQGIGADLLRSVLTRSDAVGVAAYLESSNERNLTLYRRHGFEVTTSYAALGRGPTIWRMWRQPR